MRVRLNGWQRIGIVLSVIWAVAGGWWGKDNATYNKEEIVNTAELCRRLGDLEPRLVECSMDPKETSTYRYLLGTPRPWYGAAMVGLAPILFMWLAVYSLIGLWRWIRRGIQHLVAAILR